MKTLNSQWAQIAMSAGYLARASSEKHDCITTVPECWLSECRATSEVVALEMFSRPIRWLDSVRVSAAAARIRGWISVKGPPGREVATSMANNVARVDEATNAMGGIAVADRAPIAADWIPAL